MSGSVPPSDAQGAPPPGEAPDPFVGSVLAGRYRILERLGSGAMGTVYLGEHLKIGRRDAIKVLRPGLVKDEEAIARFARGARNGSLIQHPNVCTVYDFAEADGGLWFLAMEYVNGVSLTRILRETGPLPEERAVGLAVQIACALEAAHDLGIVHRDLKPDNVMVCRGRHGEDLAKVVDFDIAKGSGEGEAADVTRMGFVIGTPEYMSPEQLAGDRLDGRSDMYSLGLVLFRMLTGRLPFRSATANDLMIERLTQEPLTLHDVTGEPFSDALQRVLDQALQRRPEDRHPDAESFVEELLLASRTSAGGAGSPPGVVPVSESAPPGDVHDVPPTRVEPGMRPPPVDARGGRSRGRRRWLIPVTSAGGAVLAGVLGWALLLGDTAGGVDPEPGETTGVEQGAEPEAGEATGPTIEVSEGEAPVVDDPPGPTEPERVEREPAEDAAAPSPPGPGPLTAAQLAEAEADLDRLDRALAEEALPPDEVQRGARSIFDDGRFPAPLRARAAFVAHGAASESGDRAAAVYWIRQAFDLDPRNRAIQIAYDAWVGRGA